MTANRTSVGRDTQVELNAPAGRVRPLRADARRNRVRLLEAAEQAFATEGTSVPLDEIARRAGVGAGTVYRHFPTKEALLAAVILRVMQQQLDDARARFSVEDPADAFYGFLARMVGEGAAKRYLVDAVVGGNADIQLVTSELTEDLRRAIEALLIRAQTVGAVRRDIGVADVMSVLAGALVAARRHADEPELRTRVMTIFLDGLRGGRA